MVSYSSYNTTLIRITQYLVPNDVRVPQFLHQSDLTPTRITLFSRNIGELNLLAAVVATLALVANLIYLAKGALSDGADNLVVVHPLLSVAF